jgi:transcriptional regulator with XRE-family HTH domain
VGVHQAGPLLREWRVRRRFSQLDLAVRAEVSAKHLSYVETGRSRPSPEMVLHLCEHLEVPLRHRNTILLAAGHAPRYLETGYDAADGRVRDRVDLVVAGHRYPAAVVDRRWNLVAANGPAMVFLAGVADHLLAPAVNVVRLSLHRDGLRSRVHNFDDYASHVLGRVRRRYAADPDPVLAELLAEFGGLAAGDGPARRDAVLPLVLELAGTTVRLFSTITTFGAPLDVALAELAIEVFYPADAASAAVLDQLAAQSGTS